MQILTEVVDRLNSRGASGGCVDRSLLKATSELVTDASNIRR